MIRFVLAGLLVRRIAGLALWVALRPGGWAVIVAATLIWLKATA